MNTNFGRREPKQGNLDRMNKINRMGNFLRKASRLEPLGRGAAFTPLQCAKVLQHSKLKRRERRAPTAPFMGFHPVNVVNPVSLRFAALRGESFSGLIWFDQV
jgi:hypothetical protein